MRTQEIELCSTKNTLPCTATEKAVDLVCRIREGSTKAEAELFRDYQRGLHFLVRHQTDDDELAKEVVQETFIVVIQRLRSRGINEPRKLSPFIHRTARNIMIGHLRKTTRRRTDTNTLQIERTAGNMEDQNLAAVREQEASIIRNILCELKCERDREILSRFYLLEQEKKDICRELQLSDVHFNRVLYRARQRFGTLIKEHDRRKRLRLLDRH